MVNFLSKFALWIMKWVLTWCFRKR